MKTLLVIAFATFGPGPLGSQVQMIDGHMIVRDLRTEEACAEAAKRYPRFDAPGPINIPGYRGIEGAWCEDAGSPWPWSSAAAN